MRKILVIQTAFIGDAVLTLPLLQTLKSTGSSVIVDVVATPQSREIFEQNPCVNKVYVLDKRNKHKSIFSILKFAGQLRKEGYSALYSPHRSFRTSLIVALSGIKETVGFDTASMAFVYRNRVNYRKDWHEVRRNLSLSGLNTGEDEWRIKPQINVDTKVKRKIDGFVGNLSGKLAAIAPGSVWETKKYPKERFVELIRFLREQGFSVLIVGGMADKDYCDSIKQTFIADDLVVSSAGEFSIIESIELISRCSFIISNDSAPTHFAMCAGIPAITIYCSTVPEFGFYPYLPGSISISYNELPCKPCGIHGHQKCPIGTFECAYKLDINSIKDAVLKITG